MIWYAKVAAGVLAVLVLLGVVLWVDVTGRYLAASEARLDMGQAVSFEAIQIPVVSASDPYVSVRVLFHLANPSPIGVEVRLISYRFYMDNLTDVRSFAAKADSIYVGAGGFYPQDAGPTIPARGEGHVWANLTVDAALQPDAVARLNRTFFGKYYPILVADLVYAIEGTSLVDRVMGILYVTQAGVAPYAP